MLVPPPDLALQAKVCGAPRLSLSRYNVRLANASPQGILMSEVHLEEHSSPIKTPKQLIIVILLVR